MNPGSSLGVSLVRSRLREGRAAVRSPASCARGLIKAGLCCSRAWWAGVTVLLISVFVPGSTGCAFDLVRVKQVSAVFSALGAGSDSFALGKEVKARLGTGFPTILRFGTVWRRVGEIEAGAVYFTEDQIVKVEASNIHEARIVVSGGRLVGFYLPVEKTYAPLGEPLTLEMKPQP